MREGPKSEADARRSNWRTSPGHLLALALLLLIGSHEAARRAGLGHGPPPSTSSADPGPKPPGRVWDWPGTQVDPGLAEPVALVRPHLFSPRPGLSENYWVVETRDCPQVVGADPLPCLRALQFDGGGRLVLRDPSLLARAAGRPVVVIVHGNLVQPILAINAGVWAQDHLDRNGALPWTPSSSPLLRVRKVMHARSLAA